MPRSPRCPSRCRRAGWGPSPRRTSCPRGSCTGSRPTCPASPTWPTGPRFERLDNRYLSWAKDETDTDDPESFLPLARLDEAAAAGRIGSVSERFYCLPTQFSHRQTLRRDTPRVLEWLREDEIDAVVMVPL